MLGVRDPDEQGAFRYALISREIERVAPSKVARITQEKQDSSRTAIARRVDGAFFSGMR